MIQPTTFFVLAHSSMFIALILMLGFEQDGVQYRQGKFKIRTHGWWAIAFFALSMVMFMVFWPHPTWIDFKGKIGKDFINYEIYLYIGLVITLLAFLSTFISESHLLARNAAGKLHFDLEGIFIFVLGLLGWIASYLTLSTAPQLYLERYLVVLGQIITAGSALIAVLGKTSQDVDGITKITSLGVIAFIFVIVGFITSIINIQISDTKQQREKQSDNIENLNRHKELIRATIQNFEKAKTQNDSTKRLIQNDISLVEKELANTKEEAVRAVLTSRKDMLENLSRVLEGHQIILDNFKSNFDLVQSALLDTKNHVSNLDDRLNQSDTKIKALNDNITTITDALAKLQQNYTTSFTELKGSLESMGVGLKEIEKTVKALTEQKSLSETDLKNYLQGAEYRNLLESIIRKNTPRDKTG